jgi:Ca2+-binding RTX toxin-like protein
MGWFTIIRPKPVNTNEILKGFENKREALVTVNQEKFGDTVVSECFELNARSGNDTINVHINRDGSSDICVNGEMFYLSKEQTNKLTVNGGDGNDVITITGQADGEQPNIKIVGGIGNDLLIAGNAGSTMDGGEGNDILIGGNGNDKLSGGAGNDWILGGRGDDSIYGGAGNDWLMGSAGKDRIVGGTGDDTIIKDRFDRFERVGGGLINRLLDGNDKIIEDNRGDSARRYPSVEKN